MSPGMILLIMLMLLALGFPIFVAMGIAGALGMMSTSSQITLFLNTSYSGLDSFPLMAVPFFILAGKLMEASGISERLVNFINFFVGKVAGALAIVGVATCALFGALSGSAVATSVSVGGIIIPGMERDGYDKAFGAALMGVAGTIGALIPPSMTFIIYGSLTSTSTGDLFIAGIIPGLLVTVLLCITAYIICKKRGYYSPEREVERSLKSFWEVFKGSFFALLCPVIILGGIYGGIFTPTEAGAVACVYAAIIACFVYKTINFKDLYAVFGEAARLCVVTMVVVAFASGLAKYLTMVNVPQSLAAFMVSIANSKVTFLFIVAFFLLLIGCIMDTTPACIVLAPILHPIAIQFGISPIHFAMVMSLALLIGLCTPPVGANLFVMSSMVKLPFMTIARQMVPFIGTLLLALVLIILFPVLSTALL